MWVLSADHGAEPTPEAERELDHNQSARRIPFSDAHRLKSSSTRFLRLTEQYIGSQDKPIRCCTSIRLNWHVTISRLRSLAMPWPHKYAVWPGIDGFYDTAHLDSVPGWIGECLRNSAFQERSGDVYYLTSEWTLFSPKPSGTSHGYPWPYDTHVPVVFAGWHIASQLIAADIQVVDLAPTLPN